MDKYLTRSVSSSSLATKRQAEDQHDWQNPRKTFKTANLETPKQLITGNRFKSLQLDSTDVHNPASSGNAPPKIKTFKVPPIFLTLKPEWTHAGIRDMISKHTKEFHIKYQGNNTLAIYCNNVEAHKKLNEGLRADQTSFHTFSRKDEKPYKVIIRGLPPSIEDDLKSEIVSLGFAEPTVTQLKSGAFKKNTTSKPIEEPTPEEQTRNAKIGFCPLYLVQLPAGSDIAKFRSIKYLCHCVIQIQKYKPKSNHPANFRQCKERLKYLEKVERTKSRGLQKQHSNQHERKNLNFIPQDTPSWPLLPEKKSALRPPPTPQPTTRKFVPDCAITTSHSDPVMAEIIGVISAIRTLKSQFSACTSLFEKVLLVMTYLDQNDD
ncbi:hypothetical protein NE865_13877 [Phthorimaea operculella]|nr:hypothetical protein NE865_13877 [Phthorimaea operculella]